MALPNEPLTRTEQYLNRTATGSGTIPDEPLTRAEQYLNKIATGSGDTPEQPLTRMEQYLDYIAENGGGGVDPESITLVTLNVSQNGTTNAPSGKAYNKVVANVQNSYGASDEGKVVSNGALVSQTAHAEVTQNGTIDTTLNNSVVVNVPDGFPTDTASGAIASFPDGADDVPVKSLVAQIAPVQSGSGDPSPTNIRPISGWTSATITRTGADNQSDTYTITFPAEAGTVYGGTLDVTNGVLTVDRKLYTFTGNEQFGVVTSTHNFFRWYSVDFINTIPDWKTPNAIKLSSYPSTIKAYWDAGADTNKSAWTVRSAAGVCFRNDDYSTASEFAASLVGQDMLYELENPVTYQLTPTEVKTLLGVNSIQANTGDVEVEYYADVDLYLQKKSVTLDTLNATANGTYTPTTGHAYSSVVVAVPIPTYPVAENNSFGGGA